MTAKMHVTIEKVVCRKGRLRTERYETDDLYNFLVYTTNIEKLEHLYNDVRYVEVRPTEHGNYKVTLYSNKYGTESYESPVFDRERARKPDREKFSY